MAVFTLNTQALQKLAIVSSSNGKHKCFKVLPDAQFKVYQKLFSSMCKSCLIFWFIFGVFCLVSYCAIADSAWALQHLRITDPDGRDHH